MLIRCPSCKHPDDMSHDTADETFDSVTCPSCGSQLSLVDSIENTRSIQGTFIGHFRLLEHVGSGHFGDVWKAWDTELDRIVALKIPRRDSIDRKSADQFLREARAAARLRHPNIVTVHEIGRDGDRIYIVSDFIQGKVLNKWTEGQPIGSFRASTLLRTIAESLEHAHQAGVIHRDLKPGNILVDDKGNPWLTDFGLAKREFADITVTASGEIIGTPAYMSPEQASGQSNKADRRSDVYSLGVVMYELLTGELPFRGGMRQLIYQIVNVQAPSLRKMNPSVPQDLETICLKALHKEPAERYSSAQELADDLARYMRGEPILAKPISRLEQVWRWSRRNPAIALPSATTLIVFVAAMVLLVRSKNDDQETVVAPRVEKAFIRSSSEPRQVLLTTEPSGAEVTFIPLHSLSGAPLIGEKIFAGKSPVNAKLSPGYYLVEAVLDDQHFHEVFRYVPEIVETASRSSYLHLDWDQEGDSIRLKAIRILSSDVTEGMAWIEGVFAASLGSDDLPHARRHTRDVPGFFIDTHEVTHGEYLERKGALPSTHHDHQQRSVDHALIFVTWDAAVSYAESLGKRLLDESEFEIAATRGGTTRFPWGDDDEAITGWPFDPVGSPAYDRLDTTPPVFGLHSNVAEWTSTWYLTDPTRIDAITVPLVEHQQRRTVRGGAQSVIEGRPSLEECRIGAANRMGQQALTWSQGIGFRCGRSPRPRLAPADFPQIVGQ